MSTLQAFFTLLLGKIADCFSATGEPLYPDVMPENTPELWLHTELLESPRGRLLSFVRRKKISREEVDSLVSELKAPCREFGRMHSSPGNAHVDVADTVELVYSAGRPVGISVMVWIMLGKLAIELLILWFSRAAEQTTTKPQVTK